MKKRDDTTKDENINASSPCAEKINHNGFTNAPPLTQLIPPIVGILSLGLTFISINSLFESRVALVVCNLGLAIDFGLTTWLWYLATSIIPTDGIQLKHLAALQKGYSMGQPRQDFDQTNLPFYCHSCKSYTNSNCFHCKRCRRCVQFFDHHCKWLNNCIGAKNYFEFYGLIITTFIMFSLCISLSSYCLSQIDVEAEQDKWVLSCSIATILVGSVPCCWLLYLFCLHTYLILTKKSTMQLIMETRTKNKVSPSEEDNKNQIFKVSFTKNQTDSQVVKKVMFRGGKEEQLESSNSQTNNNLIVTREKEDLPDPGDISTNINNKSLPPLKTKMTFSFYQKSDGKATPMTLTPHLISRP